MYFSNLTRAVTRPVAVGLFRRVMAAPTARYASNLGEVLRREVAEERSLSVMDGGLKSMVEELKTKGITIKDEPGQSVVRLFGPGMGNEKVMVEFDCQEEGDGDDEWGEEAEGDEARELANQVQDEEDIEGGDAGFRFLATVTKGPKKLVFTGTATSKISIASVSHCPTNVEHNDSSLYHGPHFDELDPEVQEAMKEYLRERNVGDDMAAFICMYADHKEQSEYLNWLEEVESFIK